MSKQSKAARRRGDPIQTSHIKDGRIVAVEFHYKLQFKREIGNAGLAGVPPERLPNHGRSSI